MQSAENRLQNVASVMIVLASMLGACAGGSKSSPQSAPSNTGGASAQAENVSDAAQGVSLPVGCAPPGLFACNPVNNQGCDGTTGEACDDDLNGGFTCYPAPNDVPVGGACNIVDGPSCQAGAVCRDANDANPNGTCAPYCCSDADCASGSTCVALDSQYGSLGYCT